LTELGLKATTANLNLKANQASPTFTGVATVPQIMFNLNSDIPTLTTRSVGTKLVLYPSLSSVQADYAIGVEGSHMWLSIAGDAVGNGFKFYGKNTNVATISGTGNFSCNGGVTCSSQSVNGDLTVSGNVNLTSFLPIKPWAGCEVRMSGTTVTVSQSTGYNTMTAANVIRSAVGVYTISIPLHPYVNNFTPVLTARTANATDFFYPTCKFISPTTTTNIVVYMRNGAVLFDGDFFFATIP
jgi:hypothetical protein